MFPLKQKIIGGYEFDRPTFYSAHHVGVDYRANFEPLYAPFNGTIIEVFEGVEGGLTIWFRPDHDNVVMRFLHLSKFMVTKGQKVVEGQQIAVTGNSGKLTRGAHLHLDISRPSVVIAWPGHFINPEEYDWKVTANVDQPVGAAVEAVTASVTHEVPITFWITIAAPLGKANFREEPNTGSRVAATYSNGEMIECIATVQGELVGITRKDGSHISSDKWYKSKLHGYYVSAAVCNHN